MTAGGLSRPCGRKTHRSQELTNLAQSESRGRRVSVDLALICVPSAATPGQNSRDFSSIRLRGRVADEQHPAWPQDAHHLPKSADTTRKVVHEAIRDDGVENSVRIGKRAGVGLYETDRALQARPVDVALRPSQCVDRPIDRA